MAVTQNDVKNAAQALGIQPGDTVLVHSSFKSLGPVEGGAATVIGGFLDAVGPEGNLVFPTLCQQDFGHAYENWHMDAPSSVGLLTNVFRKRPNAFRSNQATHSVAAIGKDAVWFTQTHGVTGKRAGNMGDTPFSSDSPWEKMYQMNTKILLLGVEPRKCTMRHYAEYCFVNDSLNQISHLPEYGIMKNALWYYGNKPAIWPHIDNDVIFARLDKNGSIRKTKCGDATLLCIETKPFVALCIEALENADVCCLRDVGICYEETKDWLIKLRALKKI
jgi:aminoglycoside N3'-acetyltransferase